MMRVRGTPLQTSPTRICAYMLTLAAVAGSCGVCPVPGRPPSASARDGVLSTWLVCGGDSTSKCRFMLVDTRWVCNCECAGEAFSSGLSSVAQEA
jgi:hypothetical protein